MLKFIIDITTLITISLPFKITDLFMTSGKEEKIENSFHILHGHIRDLIGWE